MDIVERLRDPRADGHLNRAAADEIESLRQQLAAMTKERNNLAMQAASLADDFDEMQDDLVVAQARIDELMLEYCPEEMTPEQIANWEAHQVPVSDAESAAIDAEMKGGGE